MSISLIVITKNEEKNIEGCINSARDLIDEVVVVDNFSKDTTVEKARRLGATVYLSLGNLGYLKALALKKARGDWIINLDADEKLSDSLREKIKKIINSPQSCDAYLIPFLNHFLGDSISHGGEGYKMLRLFKKKAVSINNVPVHEHFKLKRGFKLCELGEKIYHYSYPSIWYVFKKFSYYAFLSARLKFKRKERVTLKKLFLYGPRLFIARYFFDKGYKDGLKRIFLDLLFGYMEGLTYWLLFLLQISQNLKNSLSKFLR